MGLFGKAKDIMTGKKWLHGFKCPNCGSNVYKEIGPIYICEECGKLTGDAFYCAYEHQLKEEGYSSELAKDLANNRKKKDQKEIEQKKRAEILEAEARSRGDNRKASNYEWQEYTEKILIGEWNTKDRYDRNKNGDFIIDFFSKDNDKENKYEFYVYMKDSVNRKYGFNVDGNYYYGEHDRDGEGLAYFEVWLYAKDVYVDWNKTTKNALYIIIRKLKVNVDMSLSHYVVEKPYNYCTKYGSIEETQDALSDWALKKLEQKIRDRVTSYLRGAKRNYFGFDDVMYSNIYFEYINY